VSKSFTILDLLCHGFLYLGSDCIKTHHRGYTRQVVSIDPKTVPFKSESSVPTFGKTRLETNILARENHCLEDEFLFGEIRLLLEASILSFREWEEPLNCVQLEEPTWSTFLLVMTFLRAHDSELITLCFTKDMCKRTQCCK